MAPQSCFLLSPDHIYVDSQALLAKETAVTASALPLVQKGTAGDLRACVNWENRVEANQR
ncbi:hypothetical protein CORC01_05152 [Colletotrichum orchidophilum]|uniref:Uncharacterized protein n=1 Tax=Colletotrichum orchidophilum TaxID=1209926 RepID=A0A1G4BDT6_9PEZI|nr:uncharacterized protein CORC01_05152 [Colletotrichum orchidophilum]OHE99574.1 hypothetical protein CORC01_05152 [Colletotrichum orchidophilum]